MLNNPANITKRDIL